MLYTKDAPTPPIFRLWSAIHAIGACGERRVWTQLGINKLHPNLFLFLVGPPGTGKSQAINPMADILRRSQAVNLAPTDMTKQGLLDALAECAKGAVIFDDHGITQPFDYHFMAICISELSNFMSSYDPALAGLLTDLFDCPPMNEEKKRSGAGNSIPFPGISFIMGTATQNLGNTISDELWGSGFMARVVMIYSDLEVIPLDMFAVNKRDEALEDQLTIALRRIGELTGPMIWERAAQEELRDFRERQKVGAPLHNLLTFYVTRRWLHLGKLCMISALADERMVVRQEDVALAKSWLFAAEAVMPEIFKDMISHEDGQIYKSLNDALWGLYSRTKQPIHYAWIARWLAQKTANHSVERFILLAEKMNYIQRVAGTSGDEAEYIPTMPGSF